MKYSIEKRRLFTLKIRFITIVLLCMVLFTDAKANVLSYDGTAQNIVATNIQVLEDATGKLNYTQALVANGYKNFDKEILNFGISESAFWLKFDLLNTTGVEPVIMLGQPLIDKADIYVIDDKGQLIYTQTIDKEKPFSQRKYQDPNYIFNSATRQGQTHHILIRIKSNSQLVIPVKIATDKEVIEESYPKQLLIAIFAGIVLVMSLYNFFVYLSVRDRSYLLYVLYIITVGLTQITLPGFSYQYMWPNSSWLALQGPTLFSCLGAISAIEFIKNFLRTKEHTRKLHYGLIFFNVIFVISIAMSLAGKETDAFKVMQLNTAVASLYALYISYRIYRLNYRPARFFLLSWTILLIGAVVFVLKDFGVVAYTTTTSFAILITSAIEIILLSFALADKINIFRKEREAAQERAMQAVEENARIVREQNIILEAKVTERTHELKASNEELNKTLVDLKEAEMQLVESEKMASLGQLTAGIAHEINNPINFVTSNVKPLKRDVQMMIDMVSQIEEITLQEGSVEDKKQKIEDLKQNFDYDYLKTEIDYLINGINEGSSRTAEIVKGLRIFSRLDEDDLKKADINEGLESTLVIVNNQLDNRIEVIKQFSELPPVECYPGKLNQVFMNMISNALHAIKSRYKEEKGGILTIATSGSDSHVLISIRDNGTGMDENTKKKLFEPFFTTKDVGEGTGLGLSIAYNTIVKHNGTITVNSELGAGTEFIIEIPIIHQN